MEFEGKICCVFGHRKIEGEEELREKLEETFEKLIMYEGVKTFLFGSKGEFNDLCRKVLKEEKETFEFLKRVYVRDSGPYSDEFYAETPWKDWEKSYFPERARNAGRAAYTQRNYDMIDKSEICVVYYKEDYLPPRRKRAKRDVCDYQPKSGTALAYEYAVTKLRKIINLAD